MEHDVHVVKPLAARKYLVTRRRGKVVSARYSPSRETIYDLFYDLVHFVGVFPHPRLALEAVLDLDARVTGTLRAPQMEGVFAVDSVQRAGARLSARRRIRTAIPSSRPGG